MQEIGLCAGFIFSYRDVVIVSVSAPFLAKPPFPLSFLAPLFTPLCAILCYVPLFSVEIAEGLGGVRPSDHVFNAL